MPPRLSPKRNRKRNLPPAIKKRRSGNRSSGRKGSRRWAILFSGLLFSLILLGLVFSLLHARVLEIRQKRARAVVSKVLTQTSAPPLAQERYAEAIARCAVSKGLNPAVVAAIVVVESSGDPLTVSGTGDLGLMQVNVRVHRRDFDFQNRNLLNPEENIDVGTTILKTMLKRHGEEKAIAAYNGLVPEKTGYAGRVDTVLGKAGISLQDRSVAYTASAGARLGDWWEAFRKSTF